MVPYVEKPLDVARRPGWVIAFSWTIATLMAVLLTLGPVVIYISRLPDYSFAGDNGVGPLLIFSCGLFFMVAPAVGIAQGLLLRFLLGFTNWGRWSFATTFSIVAALALPSFASGIGSGVGTALCVFVPVVVIAGVFQSPLLAKYWRKGSWWTLAHLAGCVMGLLVGGLARTYAFTPIKYGLLYYPPDSALRWLAVAAIGVAVYGIITGCALVWIVREPAEVSQTTR